VLAKIAADECNSATEFLLNYLTIFELTNTNCRYFGKQWNVRRNTMADTFTIMWKEVEIGELFDLSMDMWYLEGKWQSNGTNTSKEFEDLLSTFDPKSILNDPSKALKTVLFTKSADNRRKLYCLAMSLKDNYLSLRQVVAEEALDLFFPNRQ
jgi:hypothetical protein